LKKKQHSKADKIKRKKTKEKEKIMIEEKVEEGEIDDDSPKYVICERSHISHPMSRSLIQTYIQTSVLLYVAVYLHSSNL